MNWPWRNTPEEIKAIEAAIKRIEAIEVGSPAPPLPLNTSRHEVPLYMSDGGQPSLFCVLKYDDTAESWETPTLIGIRVPDGPSGWWSQAERLRDLLAPDVDKRFKALEEELWATRNELTQAKQMLSREIALHAETITKLIQVTKVND